MKELEDFLKSADSYISLMRFIIKKNLFGRLKKIVFSKKNKYV